MHGLPFLDRYKESGATKVSITHFKDRDGRELSNISPRRYFCTQCHVPQTNAKSRWRTTLSREQKACAEFPYRGNLK